MVRTHVSPTGIETQAWIWVRACQVVCATATFITGCIQGGRLLFLLLLLFPVWLLSIWNLIDASVFYTKRYTRGAGSVSILRTLNDWFINCLLGTTIPFCFIGANWHGEGNFGDVFIWVEFGLVLANLCFYFASAIMLSVEDSRMRRDGRVIGHSATEAMPTNGDPMYRGLDVEILSKMTSVDSQTALMLVNNMLKNGFTIKQLSIMGSQPVAMSSVVPDTPHSPSPAVPTTPPLQVKSDVKCSSYEPAPPHYDT